MFTIWPNSLLHKESSAWTELSTPSAPRPTVIATSSGSSRESLACGVRSSLFRRSLATPRGGSLASSSGTFSSRETKWTVSCKTFSQQNPSQRDKQSYPPGHASTPPHLAGGTQRSSAGGETAALRMLTLGNAPGG